MSEDPRRPLGPGATLANGAYTVNQLLGSGGFALTYSAYQGRWKFQVCLKEFFPLRCNRSDEGRLEGPDELMREGLQAFRDEAECLARFSHPGIVRVLGTFEENGTSYLVQELLDGVTLSQGLEVAGNMGEATVLTLAQQVGQALLMVHAAGLVHSDLKPDNIFLTRDGRYVLLDFGLTRGFLSNAAALRGGRGLSSGYAPPEQYQMGKKLTPAADVYSFAATLYALLAGKAPVDAQTRAQGHPLLALTGVSKRVEEALLNALHLDVRQRTPGVREFLHQLGLDSTPKAISYKPPPFSLQWVQKAHPCAVGALSLDARSPRLYSSGNDGVLKVWSWPDLDLLGQVQLHEGAVAALSVSECGRFLVSGACNGEIKLWDTGFVNPGVVLAPPESVLNTLHMCRDRVVAAFASGKCTLFEPGAEPASWQAHEGPANSVHFHPSGELLVTGGKDAVVRMWSVPQLELKAELKLHGRSVQCVRFSADGTALLTSGSDHNVIYYDVATQTKSREFKQHGALVFQAEFCCLDAQVISLAGDRALRGLNLENGGLSFQHEFTPRTKQLVVDPARPLVACGNDDGCITVFQIPVGMRATSLSPASAPGQRPIPAPRAVEGDQLLGTRLGQYLLTHFLGAGGMATVYKALPLDDMHESSAVAVKVLLPDQVPPDFQQRFEREIQVSMKLHHPNVIRILDWGRHDQLSYLVMEYVEGETLRSHIPENGMDLAKARLILDDIVEGLAYAHSRGIVHRDLKPENVMIRKDGRAQLMDFGLARDGQVQTLTQRGVAIGTAEYMAPEQLLRGPTRDGLTVKSDQYALGILIFELLCGRRPFEWAADPIRLVKILSMQVHQAPPSIRAYRPDVPESVEQVLNRMLSKDPEARFDSVKDAGYALFRAAAVS